MYRSPPSAPDWTVNKGWVGHSGICSMHEYTSVLETPSCTSNPIQSLLDMMNEYLEAETNAKINFLLLSLFSI
jgi:hypothetical protein